MNRVFISGVVVSNVEQLHSGGCNFLLKSYEKYGGREHTEVSRIVCFDTLINIKELNLSKGVRITIEGMLKTRLDNNRTSIYAITVFPEINEVNYESIQTR